MNKLSTTTVFVFLCLAFLWPREGVKAQCNEIGVPVASTTSWDYTNYFGTAQFPIHSPLIVGAGTTVNISNQTIYFRGNGRIIVREGGQFIANQCKFTTTDAGTTWEGFLVEGAAPSQQTTRLSLSSSDIDNAMTAVAEGCDLVNPNPGQSVVTVAGCNIFRPRIIGVDFRPRVEPSISVVAQTNFLFQSFPFPDPTMINIEGTCGIRIERNNLLNAGFRVYMEDVAEKGTAIRVSNATAFIQENVIRQWHIGIDVKNDAGCETLVIDDNTIKNSAFGVVIDNQDGTEVINNRFTLNRKIEDMIIPSTTRGKIRMDALTIKGNPAEVRVENNTFKHREDQPGTPPAPQDWNAIILEKTNGTLVEGNNFQFSLIDSRGDFNTGVRITGANLSSQIRCNNFDLDPDRVAGQIGIFLDGSDASLPTQGSSLEGTGNLYAPLTLCANTNWHLARTTSAGTFVYWTNPNLVAPPTCNPNLIPVQVANTNNGCGQNKTGNTFTDLQATPMTVFPNPANDEVQIALTEGFEGQVEVWTSEGKLVLRQRPSQDLIRLNLGHLPKGIYLIRAGQASQRLILQ